MVTIVELHSGKGDLCRRILAALPQWFGIPEAVDQYVAGVEALPMYVARSDGEHVGFVSVKAHTPAAAEVYVTGVLPFWHRRGVGRMLFAAAEEAALRRGARFLTVKTLAPDHPDPHYAATRRFHEAVGFAPIEIFPTLWHPQTPCLLMLKPLVPPGRGS